MFEIIDAKLPNNPTILNDFNDIYDVIIGITGKENKAKSITSLATRMQFGDTYKTKQFKISCFDESKAR